MKLPRVVYTRVESRANPDYQILGRSADCAGRATDDALEGFFRSLLGQPDTLTGFRRSCFFAPLAEPVPGATRPVWIAGVARPSDKPDRHGRRGILNYSAVVLTEDEAAAIRFDPWPLFADPVVTDEALPFVDEPDHRFEAWTAPEGFFDAPPGSDDDATAFVRHDKVLQALGDGHSLLVCPTRSRGGATTAAGDDDMDSRIERLLRAIHHALPPSGRRSVPMVTHTFRPVTSAARFRLVGSGGDPPLGDKHWRLLVSGWEPLPGGVRVDVRARDPQASGSGRMAASVPVSHGADPWQPSASRRPNRHGSRLLHVAGSNPVISGVVGLLLIAAVVTALLWPGGDDNGQPQSGGGAPGGAGASNGPTGDGATGNRTDANDAATNSNTNEGNGNGGDSAPRDYSPAALESRWRQTGAWRGLMDDPGVRRRYDEFVDYFWPGLESVWNRRPLQQWPSRLLRLTSQVAFVQWQLDGHEERDLFVEYQLVITASRLREYGSVELQVLMRHPDSGVPLGSPLRVHYERARSDDDPQEVYDERTLPAVRAVPGMVLDIRGRVRVDRPGEQPIGETIEIESIADFLERDPTNAFTLMQGEHGDIVRLAIVGQRIVTRTDGNARFPTVFVPVGD